MKNENIITTFPESEMRAGIAVAFEHTLDEERIFWISNLDLKTLDAPPAAKESILNLKRKLMLAGKTLPLTTTDRLAVDNLRAHYL